MRAVLGQVAANICIYRIDVTFHSASFMTNVNPHLLPRLLHIVLTSNTSLTP